MKTATRTRTRTRTSENARRSAERTRTLLRGFQANAKGGASDATPALLVVGGGGRECLATTPAGWRMRGRDEGGREGGREGIRIQFDTGE